MTSLLPYLEWRNDLSSAVVFAGALQLILLLLLRRLDRQPAGKDATDTRRDKQLSRMLALFSITFLSVTILTGARYDYLFHLKIWDAVLRGDVPWWISEEWGLANPYGPLFNALAVPRRINPLAPKLLHAFAYILFVTWLLKRFARPQTHGGLPGPALIGWILNPLPWIEIAYVGHFDVLVGLSCVAAVHAQRCGRDVRAGIYVGLGVLLKFFPIVILPFLGLERMRVRVRLIASSSMVIVLGIGASVLFWGLATFQPFVIFTRGPNQLSVLRFLWGDLSPFRPWLSQAYVHALATPSLVIAGLVVFVVYWLRAISAPTGVVLAILTTLLFYQAGFLSYQMVLFTVAWYWYMTFPDRGWLASDPLCSVAFTVYFGWLGLFSVFMYGVGIHAYFLGRWAWVEDVVGLPTFLLGLLLLGALWRASRREFSLGEATRFTHLKVKGTQHSAVAP